MPFVVTFAPYGELAASPTLRVGGWHSPEDSQFYLDLSRVVPSSEEALALAREAGQLSIFDHGEEGYALSQRQRVARTHGRYIVSPIQATEGGDNVAKKTIFVSDLSGKEISNDRDAVKITVTFGDARRGQYVLDAHPDDPEVKSLLAKGTQQARRGRRPKAASN